MFAGRRRRSSNVRVMQLFHELKQQFPTVPDHVVTSCIAAHAHTSKETTIRHILEAAALINSQQEPMGRSPPPPPPPPPLLQPPPPLQSSSGPPPAHIPHPSFSPIIPTSFSTTIVANCDERPQHKRKHNKQHRSDMNNSDSASCNRLVKTGARYSKGADEVNLTELGRSAFYVKRPDHLDIKPNDGCVNNNNNSRKNRLNNIQLSEKCKDVHKLLNSPTLSDKPPRSPLTNKRHPQSPKNSPTKPERRLQQQQQQQQQQKETISTPTQTTDTLLGGGNLNLSVNVNCSMDVMSSPTQNKRTTTTLQMTPQQPWLQEPVSPRSYTSVNLTLRPPSSEPQPPIDITSRNSSLTYSTSSFDSQKGLQSRLQITVGPGGGSVSSVRTRPRSSYLPERNVEDVVPVRAGSLNNLTDNNNQPCVLLKQEVRIEKLRIELKTEKVKLVVMTKEVDELEQAKEQRFDTEIEEQLLREIKHLRCQCEQLAVEVDKKEFYQNIYTGQRGPLGRHGARVMEQDDGPKWNCHLCTFLNHPDLDKCEQCEMPKILHVSAAPGDNIHIHVTPRLSRRLLEKIANCVTSQRERVPHYCDNL